MQCMVLHGDSNIGKTLIVSKLRREHPSIFDHLKGVECRQIIAMQMPATPDQHRFYTALRFDLGAPHCTTASLSTLERLARGLHPLHGRAVMENSMSIFVTTDPPATPILAVSP